MSDAAPAASGSPPVPPVKRGAAWKIVLTVVVITGAVGYMLKASISPAAEYYKHVDEVMAEVGNYRGKNLKVHGHVVPGSIERAKDTLNYRFKIETGKMSQPEPRKPAVISATYTGIVPDTFKDGAEVVATGKLGRDDNLDVGPDGIMAKCPSKYDSKVTAKTDDVAKKL